MAIRQQALNSVPVQQAVFWVAALMITSILLAVWTLNDRLLAPLSKAHIHASVQAQGQSGAETAAARPGTKVTPMSCEKLPHVPGKAVTTALVEFPPGALSPAHRHPGSVTAYVVSGTIRSQMQGGPLITYGPGGTWFEPPGALHLLAENASTTEPGTLLTFFVADENCGPLVIPEK